MDTKIKIGNYIGITLLFCKKGDLKVKGIQTSQIFELRTIQGVLGEVDTKATYLIGEYFQDYIFLGISDLFITEKRGIFNYMGRTSYFDIKKKSEALKLIIDQDILNNEIVKLKKKNKSYEANVGLVYFNNDFEGKKYNSAIIIHTLINEFFINSDEICKVAKDNSFKDKIVKFSIESLKTDNLEFVGVSDFYLVKGEGFFDVEGSFSNIQEIESEVLSKKELIEEFNRVIKDYEFVYQIRF